LWREHDHRRRVGARDSNAGPARLDAGAAAGILESAGSVGMALGVVALGCSSSRSLGARETYAHAFAVTLVANLGLAQAALLLALNAPRSPAGGEWREPRSRGPG
jgi:hypothetical protein